VSAVWIMLAFLAGCCVGIAPWHWLAKKNERLAREIHAMTFGKTPPNPGTTLP
jgi:hypothetical protein